MKHIKMAYRYAKKVGLDTAGKKWYKEANNFARHLSNTYRISLDKTCAIIAALSPAISWEQNKRDAEQLAMAYDLNLHNEAFRYHNYSTYGPNVVKAIEILNSTKEPIEFFSKKNSGFKTRAFYLNILEPNKCTDVTIDRHAVAIALGVNSSYPEALTRKKYNSYADQYVQAANKLGLRPHELQAITWVAYKHAQDNNVKLFK